MVGLRHLSTLLTGAVAVVLAAPVVDKRAASVIPGKYIVTLKPGFSVAEVSTHLKWVRSVHARRGVSARDIDGIEKVYSIEDFNAYAGSFDSATLDEIRANFQVAAIEPDMIWTLDDVVTQSGATWGLGSISHRTPNHTEYRYHGAAGAGTVAYVVDTGVRVSHAELEGRARHGYTAYPDADNADNIGHGTHVAGTIASRTYGVAKKAGIVSVKVFDRTTSTTSIVMDGYNWAVNDILTTGRTATAIVSLSLGGPASTAFNLAVQKAHEAGVLSIVSAGNDGVDASLRSPASAAEAITVGAVDLTNTRPWWSNYGTAVDVFAPGVNVLSAWADSDTATARMDGTSMATPHVSGMVLYLKSVDAGRYQAAADVWAGLKRLATAGVVVNPGSGSPNLLAFNGVE